MVLHNGAPLELHRISGRMRVVGGKRWVLAAVLAAVMVILIRKQLDSGKKNLIDSAAAEEWFRKISDRLGYWAIPAYVGVHTLTLALCLPYAIFFEAGASLLFGFLPALFCVFSAKLLGASLSFWIGRLVFRSSGSAVGWVQKNKYFHLLSRGVERDGWKFVLLARFSPLPSYIINYALAATENISIGSLASAAVSSASGSQRSQVLSYVFPLLGILSSILITLRIKKYSSDITVSDCSRNGFMNNPIDADK
ncbi:hypothetical protein OROGR_028115 [Orobanche gracilis]